jgi:hypothetical protein
MMIRGDRTSGREAVLLEVVFAAEAGWRCFLLTKDRPTRIIAGWGRLLVALPSMVRTSRLLHPTARARSLPYSGSAEMWAFKWPQYWKRSCKKRRQKFMVMPFFRSASSPASLRFSRSTAIGYKAPTMVVTTQEDAVGVSAGKKDRHVSISLANPAADRAVLG